MAKYSSGRSGLTLAPSGKWIFDVETHSRKHQKSFTEVRDDLRLKRAIQHAVRRHSAPKHLVDSIRNMIRK